MGNTTALPLVESAMSILGEGRYLGRAVRQAVTGQVLIVESTYAASATLKRHAHARPHFCVVLEGGYEEQLGGRSATRRSGALSFLPAGCEHAERHLTAGRHLMIETGDGMLRDVARVARMPETPTTLTARSATRLGARIASELRRKDALTPLVLDALAAELLGELCRHRTARIDDDAMGPWITGVRETLDADPLGAHDLRSLGRAVGRHPVHVARSFRRRFGVSVGTYLRRRRIDWAATALRDTDTPIATIAAAAGFSDQSHFTRWCRAYLGRPPAAIRLG